mmetsp:Transcript_14556/g.16029  ORF Transcript_14556/g.16029 Transcript_14556/m.16029 type:complete len:329 (+) Transcript_14556:13-999(+)
MSNNHKRSRSAFLCITACVMFVTYHRQDMTASSSFQRKLFGRAYDPSTVTAKGKHPFDEGTVGVVINTPKCGTGGLTETFIRSFSENPYGSKCVGEDLDSKATKAHNLNCGGDRRVLRTHDMESGIEAMKVIRESTDQKCMIVTATRDPRTWLPSVFMQRRNKQMCHAKMSKKEYYEVYRQWLVEDVEKIRKFVNIARPWLLEHFGSSMTEALEESRRNGGYATFKRDKPDGLFGQCELLFMEMEASKSWPDFMESAWPGIMFAQGKTRADLCPESAANYKSLAQGYIYTKEELEYIIGDDKNTAEYFRVYGMWSDDETSSLVIKEKQ